MAKNTLIMMMIIIIIIIIIKYKTTLQLCRMFLGKLLDIWSWHFYRPDALTKSQQTLSKNLNVYTFKFFQVIL